MGRELSQLLAGSAVVPRLVAERPQEWRLGALTVVVAPQRARLRYAREPVGTCVARADAIATAWQRALERLRDRSISPDELLPRLAAAYAGIAKRPGERVSLTDVRATMQGYTRAQFAWDVARLRRERRLVIGDQRVDFGIATGHATSHRSRVVWIEDDRGSGAFYESLRLIPQEVR